MSFKELIIDNYWYVRNLDKFLRGHNGFICGGCFKNIFNKEPVKDIDVFFKNETDWLDACRFFDAQCHNFEDIFEEFVDDDLVEPDTYYFKYENDKVKAYTHIKSGITVELCRATFGNPENVLNQFDFTITKFAYYKELVKDDEGEHWEYKIICVDDFFEHLFTKRLVIDDQILFPASTFERALRYTKYGYGMCRESKVKLLTAIRQLPENADLTNNSLYDGMD